MNWKKGLSRWRKVVILIFIFVYLGLYISFNLPSTDVSAAGCTYDSDCSDNTCSVSYSDSCSGYDLTEYNSDCNEDSTTVSDSCTNTCESGTCTDCSTDCSAPSTTTHKCAGECSCSSDYGDICGTDTGVCETGTIACDGSCTGDVEPESSDPCDGEDDDCDGTVDEDESCTDNSCSQTYSDSCSGYDLTEYDNDCTQDSTTVSDSCSNTCEGGTCTDCSTDCSAPSTTTHKCAGECSCSSNYGDTCGSSTGACTTGTIACDGSCTGNTEPSTEICDNDIDDDCDGDTDCQDSDCDTKGPSASLSVSSTNVEVGTNVDITVSGSDDCNIANLQAHYDGSWHVYNAGTACATNRVTSASNTWTTTESSAGSYDYCGYIYDCHSGAYSDPNCITVDYCEDQCTEGDTRCSGGDYQECQDTDGDPCADGWETIENCGSEEGCDASSGCYCRDDDGDGYADEACGESDCDDSDASVNPGEAEICDNSIDDDCDSYTDCSDSECSSDDADKCCGDTWISDSSSFEAGNPNCCGDDSNEYSRSKDGTKSCCDLSTDCADGSGGCVTDNTCSGDQICNGGTWISHCGDGTINCGEACDTNDLDGQTCRDFGWVGGILDCYSDCTFDESDCCDPDSTPSSNIDLDIASDETYTDTSHIDLSVDNDYSSTDKVSYKNESMSWTQWYSCGSCDSFYKSWQLRHSTEGEKEARVVENENCHWDRDTIILDRLAPNIACNDCYNQMQSNLTFYPNATDQDDPGASATGYPSGVDRVDICKDSSCSEIYCSDNSLTSNQARCNYSWSDDCHFIGQQKFWIRATDRAGNSKTVLGGDLSIKRNLGCACASDLECISGWCYGEPIKVCTPVLAPAIYLEIDNS